MTVDDRFEVQSFAGSGGMGSVYRSLDRATGHAVALKVLHGGDEGSLARFAQEARALAGLNHPHIVSFVAHGVAPSGGPYLAMEWLDGETLEARLAREELRVDQSLSLARQVAAALAEAHACGVIHRDIKPSNLFLVGGEVGQVKVLDFGIARIAGATRELTRTGVMVGTPGYMAPEQARGEASSIDARTDVFSLGCVLFECLTGRPAFQGAHVMALLAKLLLEEPPRVSDLQPSVTPALEVLVARMLSKEPMGRPEGGAAVLAALSALTLDETEESAASRRSAPQRVLTSSERRLLSIVAVQPAHSRETREASEAAIDVTQTAPGSGVSPKILEALRRAVVTFGASVEALADGTVVAVLTGTGNASDRAALSARAALAVCKALPDARVVLVTGQAEQSARLPVGEVLDRAAELLAHAPPSGSVLVDTITQGLIHGRFDVRALPLGEAALLRERPSEEEAPTLLGKPSPFVGRERELRYIVDLVEEAIAEPRAVAVVVTAPAGVGKSRLRHEVVRALRGRRPTLAMSTGRGDVIGADSAFAMLSSALRSGMRIEAGQPASTQRERISRVVDDYLEEADRPRVASFLGELVGVPFPDADDPRLFSARQNAQVMAGQMRAAFIDFTRAISRVEPALLVLEDVHWGDGPSVKIIDEALRELADLPFVVLAFARPEVHTLFPRLWVERSMQEMRLRELSRKAAESLVREVLGEGAMAEQSAAIVERAEGNAFFLEELVRAAAEGTSTLPDTVVAMVQSRLDALAASSRRVLRAASVFGDVFWKGGLCALLGDDTATLEPILGELCARELIARRAERRFAGEEEYAFRHALVREGAYAMLTDRDRQLGHALAASFLLSAGEHDPMVLAEHLDRGDEGARAAIFYASAAEQALLGADLPAVLARVHRGLDRGAEDEARARLHAARANAHMWMGTLRPAFEDAARALELARPGTTSHCHALATMTACAHFLRDREAIDDLLPRLLSVEPELGGVFWIQQSLFAAATAGLLEGDRAAAVRCIERSEQIAVPVWGRDRAVMAWSTLLRRLVSFYFDRDPWSSFLHIRATLEHARVMSDQFALTIVELQAAIDLISLGAFDEADLMLRSALRVERPANTLAAMVIAHQAVLYGRMGRPREVLDLLAPILEDPSSRYTSFTNFVLASLESIAARIALGELEEAERELDTLGDSSSLPVTQRASHAHARGLLLLLRGEASLAARLAREALTAQRALGIYDYTRTDDLELLLVESLHATGDLDAARAALREIRDDLLARAARITEPAYRQSFLANVSPHQRLLALAHEWLDSDSG
jgi:eukaryotic-like serine/threonine-protein kinase